MRRTLAILLCLLPASAALADNNQALQDRITALQSRIAQLQANAPTTQQSDVSAAISTVLADAGSSTTEPVSMEFPNGWDSTQGFVLQSADGQFVLHPSLLFQFANDTAFRMHIPTGGGGETGATGHDIQNGFQMSRARIMLDGNVLDPNFTYFFQIADDSSMASPTVLDAYVMYRVSSQSPLAMKLGQFKDPLFHEANLLPSRLMAVDRSLVNQFLGGGQTGRVQGGDVIYDQNRTRAQLAFTDGYNSANTPFFEAGGQGTEVGGGEGITPTNFGVSVRGEYLLLGERRPDYNPFIQYDQFTALNARQDIVVVGGGADYSESGRDKIVFHTLDAEYNGPGGFSAYGAYLGDWRQASSPKGAPGGSFYDFGFLAQAAYLITPSVEPFVRYDYTYLCGRSLVPPVNNDVIHEITVGLNYYIHGQNLKATLDASWLPNGIPTDLDQSGALKDDAHSEITVRAQLQLSI